MATKIIWKNLYNDLPTHVAEALRTARLKPEQIIEKTEGELMAIPGITEEDVNSIRAIYNADSLESIQKVVAKTATNETPEDETKTEVEAKAPAKVVKARVRSARYKRLAGLVSKDQSLTVAEAVAKVAELARGRKMKTVDLSLNVKEIGLKGELKLPHSTGKEVKIAIYSDEIATKIQNGQIDFDMLLATPADMAKLARFAKVLGPRGLMPNPRNNTVTTDPEKRAKELASGGTLPYKTEGKFPIIHLNLGPITQDQQQLIDNLTETFKSIGIAKIKTAYLSCTQTPSVKINLGTI